jgi:hypothetical protein
MALGNVAHCEAGLIVIGDLHEFKRVFWHNGLCGRASAKPYSVDKSVLVLMETFDYPGLPGLDHLDDVIVGKFSGYTHGHEVYQRITAGAERDVVQNANTLLGTPPELQDIKTPLAILGIEVKP